MYDREHSVETLETDCGSQVQLLRLPNGPFLVSGILFVRDFYQSFYDSYVGVYAKGSKLIVCGTPGIGKSAFGWKEGSLSYCTT